MNETHMEMQGKNTQECLACSEVEYFPKLPVVKAELRSEWGLISAFLCRFTDFTADTSCLKVLRSL